jgi:von Willebrand factor type A domain
MLLIDDSGSMFRPEADQDGLRYAAAASVVDLLRRLDVAALGVLHWGSYCPADLLLRPTTPQNVRGTDMALRMPSSPLGGTDLSGALRMAHSVTQEDVPHLQPNYLVITDGLESLGRSLQNAVTQLPDRSVRVLLVDRAGKCDSYSEQRWRQLSLGAFLRLVASDPDDWAWAAAVALFAGIGTAYPAIPDLSDRKYLW